MSFEGQTVVIGTDNSYNGGLSVAMPLFNMSLIRLTQLSEVNIKLALESSRESKLNLKNNVEKAYYTALFTRELYDIMKISMDLAEQTYIDAKNKYEQGLAAEYDMIRAEVQVSNLRPNLIEAENNIKIADFQVKLLLGLPLDIEVRPVGNLADYENEYQSFNELYGYALNQNSTLKQLDIQNELLSKQLDVQKAEYLPSLSLTYNYMYLAMNDNFRFSSYKWYPTSTLGLTLRVPIFSGFTRKNKASQIRASIAQLDYQREYTESGLQVQVKNALVDMQKTIEQLESNKVGIQSAQKAYTIAQVRYQSGMGTILEMNDSEVALRQARLNYNQSLYNYMLAKSDYDLLVGKE
ncbi:MAG: TolC family protein [Candidatus Azobacteroides sp.]|nr:TolC family protein [Candidatus Azobacteroides sp.]